MPSSEVGSSQLKLPSILPFFDICFALYLAGLPPAPWSGGQLLVSRPHDLSLQLAASHYQFISLRLVLTVAFGNLPHTGRLGLPWLALHGFLFLARGTTPHSAHCCASYSDLNVTLTHVASTSLFKTTFSVAP